MPGRPLPQALRSRARIGEIEMVAIDVTTGQLGSTVAGAPDNEAVLLLAEERHCNDCVTLQDGREARLSVGDFTLCETTRPYEVCAAGPCRMLVVGIPRALLLRYVPCPEEVTAVAMSARESLNGLVSDYLRNLWARFPDVSLLPDAWQVCHATLSLIASAYARLPRARPVRRSAASAHRARIRTHIERYLTDPDLTPSTIARACQINVRYMHRLYAREDETLGQYILRRRLEECARALRSPKGSRSITEIAFAYGFKSATHFGRAFRDRYHLTPGSYRRTPQQA
jgi:AraC-like DNA-binding protein